MSKYKLSEHKDEILTHIIKNLIWLPIAAIIPIIWKLITVLYDNIKMESQYFTIFNILIVICIILTIVSIVLSIFLLYKSKQNKNIKDNRNNEFYSDYRFSSIVAELIFSDNRKDITLISDYQMTVLSDTVTEFKRDIIWTGSKYNGTKIISMDDDRYDIEDSTRNRSPYFYIIKYNSEKKRGDHISFKTETSVIDENLEMIPDFSFKVKHQIDELVLKIIVPKDMVKNVNQSIYVDRAKSICISKSSNIKKEVVRDLVVYTYKISNPTLLYHYFIEWEFTKQ